MKHSEIYDKHEDRRKKGSPKKKGEHDKWDRKARVSFKNYVRSLRDTELENEADDLDQADDRAK